MARQIITNTGLTMEEIRLKAAGLHFSKELLTEREREILTLLEGVIDILDDSVENNYFRGYAEELGERYRERKTVSFEPH